MQNLLRVWIGAGRPFSVEQASVIVKRKHKFTRVRRMYYLQDNPHNMTLAEFVEFAKLAGPKFTNDVIDLAGQTGAISIKGWMSQEEVNLAAAHYWTVQNEPGNGKERKIRRALLRLIRRARAHLSKPRMA